MQWWSPLPPRSTCKLDGDFYDEYFDYWSGQQFMGYKLESLPLLQKYLFLKESSVARAFEPYSTDKSVLGKSSHFVR